MLLLLEIQELTHHDQIFTVVEGLMLLVLGY